MNSSNDTPTPPTHTSMQRGLDKSGVGMDVGSVAPNSDSMAPDVTWNRVAFLIEPLQ